MKKKIILVRDVTFDFDSIRDVTEDHALEWLHNNPEIIILSDVVEVEFTEAPKEHVSRARLQFIDKQMTKVNADAQAAITALEGRKQQLLDICSD